MSLTMFEPEDDNNNSFPMIYTLATSVTNPAPFYQQVNEFLAPLRADGYNPLDMSAYLDKLFDDTFDAYQSNSERIMKYRNKCELLPSGDENHHDVVLVWEIVDVTMLSRDCIGEIMRLRPDVNVSSLFLLMKSILEQANFNDVEEIKNCNVVNIEDAFSDDKIAPKFEALKHLYNDVQQRKVKRKRSIISHDIIEKSGMVDNKDELCRTAEQHQQIFNQRWKSANKCLKLVNQRSDKSRNKKYANVVVTEHELAFGFTQLLLSGSASDIPIENVYSTFRVCKDSVFNRIKQRFGEKCTLIHATSGPIYVDRRLPYWPIRANEAIKLLYNFLRDVLLK